MVADTPKHGYIEFLERVAMITLTQVITVKTDRMCDINFFIYSVNQILSF